MRSALSESQHSVAELRQAVQTGSLGPQPSTIPITGASTIYQTTQFPTSTIKYHNYYLLLRSESYFGACSYMPNQLDSDAAALFSGRPLGEVLEDHRLPVQIAALDAYLGVVYPHQRHRTREVQIDAGAPIEKARQRDALIADLAGIQPSHKVALIGVVNPLIEAISQRGGICLPCDLQLKETQWGDPVERDMDKVLEQADNVICTAMTLSNGTFDHILRKVREKGIPLTVYAQTGSAIIAQFVGAGVTALLAEPFPFTQFSGDTSRLYVYTAEKGEAAHGA